MRILVACAGVAALGLSACGPSAGGNIYQPAPNPKLTSDGENVPTISKTANVSDLSAVILEDVTLQLTTKGDIEKFDLNYNGTSIQIDSAGGSTYTGSALGGSITAMFTPSLIASRNEMIGGRLVITDSGGADYDGFAVFGWKADAKMVSQLASATYDGGAIVNVYYNDGTYAAAKGSARLFLNSNNTVSGFVYNVKDNGGNATYPISPAANPHINFDAATIVGNAFSDNFSFDADALTAFGLSDVGNAVYSGHFYQQFGDGIGATLTSSNATISGGGTATIVGGFVAQQ